MNANNDFLTYSIDGKRSFRVLEKYVHVVARTLAVRRRPGGRHCTPSHPTMPEQDDDDGDATGCAYSLCNREKKKNTTVTIKTEVVPTTHTIRGTVAMF